MTDTVTVPSEPTPQMVGAGWNAFLSKDGPSDVIDVYRAMLAAAPPSEPGEVERWRERAQMFSADWKRECSRADAAEAAVDRLTGELAEARATIGHLEMHLKLCGDSNARLAQESLDEGGRAEKAEARADRLQAQVERLAEALRPFAAVAAHDIGEVEADTDKFTPMQERFAYAPLLTVGDFRRARAALASLSGDGDGWREITEDDQPSLDVTFLLGWWDELHPNEWDQVVSIYGCARGGWRHGQATHYRPLPAPPPPAAAGRRALGVPDEPS